MGVRPFDTPDAFCYTNVKEPEMTPPTEAKELKEGDLAPDFTVKDDASKSVKLSDFRGRTVVLYFYPADDTPGCTKESCSFRDHKASFDDRNTVILGVSPDGVDSHVKFKQKYSLTFPLLADTDRRIHAAYGVRNRSTFVIGPDGKIKKAFRGVRVDGHTEEVLAAL